MKSNKGLTLIESLVCLVIIGIGFIANVRLENIHRVGNTALQGASQMLLSGRLRSQIEEICNNIEHIELETTEDFFELFVDGCQFNPMIM